MERIEEFESTGIIKLPGGVELKMVKVEAGTFTMGETDEEVDKESFDDETPHSVTLTRDFYIGQTEVTQAQWEAVTVSNPSIEKGDNLPVEQVSWDDAREFCDKLNAMCAGNLPAGYRFDLPTEAQWEYAARGGNKSKGNKYSGSNDIGSVAWYGDNSGSKSHPVETKQANELGLCDMTGNVWEWCRDWYESGYAADPEFLRGNNGLDRVYRGGGWGNGARLCRVASRDDSGPGSRGSDLGFRLALVPVQ